MRNVLLASALLAATGCAPDATDTAQPAPAPAAPATPPVLEQVTAKAGVAKQGRSLDGVDSPIAQPAKALFTTKEKVVFDIAIPKTMQLFEASNGRKPKSHDEFMTKIVKEGMIKLPELPEGHTYVYDPKRGELMVERPEATEAPAQ